MCQSCWVDDGSPTALAPASERVIELVQQIYATPEGGTGGNLHVVLDDWNLESSSIFWCLDRPHLTPAERECAMLLLAMTYDERSATIARWEGFSTA